MNEFDWDVVQKKRIARGARYTNVKKPGCTLPSDSLTAGQIKKLHGEVKTVKMDEPITWEEWKALPKDLATEYYNGIIDRFQVGQPAIAKMMGTSQGTLSKWIQLNELKVKKLFAPTGRDNMKTFIDWYKPSKAEFNTVSVTTTEVLPSNPIKETSKEKTPQSGTQSVKTAWLENYHFKWSEVTSWNEIVTFVKNLPLPEHGYVELIVTGC